MAKGVVERPTLRMTDAVLKRLVEENQKQLADGCPNRRDISEKYLAVSAVAMRETLIRRKLAMAGEVID